MIVYRIEREKYLPEMLKGIGASKSEGNRWNSLDTKMVYTSESRALATLELSAHLDLSEDLPSDRYLVEIDIPSEIVIQVLELDDLPEDWDSKPPEYETQVIGDQFVKMGQAAVLKVPSAIIPEESNFLINPLHPEAKKIKVAKKRVMTFDSRVYGYEVL